MLSVIEKIINNQTIIKQIYNYRFCILVFFGESQFSTTEYVIKSSTGKILQRNEMFSFLTKLVLVIHNEANGGNKQIIQRCGINVNLM